MSQPLRQNAVGATITLTLVDQAGDVIDLSTATLTDSLYLRSPNGKLLIKRPSFVTNGTDGEIVYTTIAGDLSENGTWQAEFKLVLTGVSIPSAILPFVVAPIIYP